MTTTQDDRTPEQHKTHALGVVARDNFMSGWGGANGGYSRVIWACAPEADLDALLRWVQNRREMRYVSIVDVAKYRVPRGTAHLHVYVCGVDHPSQPRRFVPETMAKGGAT